MFYKRLIFLFALVFLIVNDSIYSNDTHNKTNSEFPLFESMEMRDEITPFSFKQTAEGALSKKKKKRKDRDKAIDSERIESESPVEKSEKELAQDNPESYVLPLTYDDDAPLLVIPVPQSFKLAFNGSSYPDVLFLEFIPQNENINYWSELITICQTTEVLDAHTFIKTFKSVIEESQSLDSYPNYTSYIRCGLERGIKVGYYISEHPSINPHQRGIQAPRYNELLKVKTVQGEDRIWVIQYAIRYDPRTITDEQYEEILEKIQVFFKTCKISSNVTGSPI